MTSKLIYVADDERIITHLLEFAFLRVGNYEVHSFSSGEDLLKNMDVCPDAVVLDYSFEGHMTGLETLKEIKQKKNELPVIMLTGQEEAELKQAFYQNGAFKYIHKSGFFVDDVLDTVDCALAQ